MDTLNSARAIVYIGLGSNLGEPLQRLRQGLEDLRTLPRTHVLDCSPFYGSAPMGPQDQPDYVNAVARLETFLDPQALLAALQRIEADNGRDRSGQRWGSRTLDLDILLYGDQVIQEPNLIVPHPGINQRIFVLKPLFDLVPELEIPGMGQVSVLLQRCPALGLWPLSDC